MHLKVTFTFPDVGCAGGKKSIKNVFIGRRSLYVVQPPHLDVSKRIKISIVHLFTHMPFCNIQVSLEDNSRAPMYYINGGWVALSDMSMGAISI